MADEQIFIRCKRCGQGRSVVKFYEVGGGDGWKSWPTYPEEPIAEWMAAHLNGDVKGCEPASGRMLDEDPTFELETEGTQLRKAKP